MAKDHGDMGNNENRRKRGLRVMVREGVSEEKLKELGPLMLTDLLMGQMRLKEPFNWVVGLAFKQGPESPLGLEAYWNDLASACMGLSFIAITMQLGAGRSLDVMLNDDPSKMAGFMSEAMAEMKNPNNQRENMEKVVAEARATFENGVTRMLNELPEAGSQEAKPREESPLLDALRVLGGAGPLSGGERP